MDSPTARIAEFVKYVRQHRRGVSEGDADAGEEAESEPFAGECVIPW